MAVLAIVNSSCKGKTCIQLPGRFTNYTDGVAKVRAANFEFCETLDTDKSTWIDAVSFYSCDRETGYLIMETAGKEYIHAGVPMTLWDQFKYADSYGDFYNHNFRHKYRCPVIK